MRFFGRLVLIAVTAALVATGCGGTVLDTSKTEDTLKQDLQKSLEKPVTSVDCPSDQEVEPGATFTCTVTLAGGEERTETLRIRNEDADLSVLGLSSNK